MKNILIISLSLITTACISQSEISSDFKKLEGLVGTWDRTNISKPGRTAHEVWLKKGENKLGGYGVILQESDTVLFEKFELVIKDAAIYYVADVPENKQPVFFKVTFVSATSFICENPQHDFPKKITYDWDHSIMRVQISGDGKSSDFLFKRK